MTIISWRVILTKDSPVQIIARCFILNLFWCIFHYIKAFMREKIKENGKNRNTRGNFQPLHQAPPLLFITRFIWRLSLLTKLLALANLTTVAWPYKFTCLNTAQYKTRTQFSAFILRTTLSSTALCFPQLLRVLRFNLNCHVLADTCNLDVIVWQVNICCIHLSAHFGIRYSGLKGKG